MQLLRLPVIEDVTFARYDLLLLACMKGLISFCVNRVLKAVSACPQAHGTCSFALSFIHAIAASDES